MVFLIGYCVPVGHVGEVANLIAMVANHDDY